MTDERECYRCWFNTDLWVYCWLFLVFFKQMQVRAQVFLFVFVQNDVLGHLDQLQIKSNLTVDFGFHNYLTDLRHILQQNLESLIIKCAPWICVVISVVSAIAKLAHPTRKFHIQVLVGCINIYWIRLYS